MPLHRDVWWLLGSTAAAIAAAPLIVHGDADVSARRQAAAQRIEQLSPAERQHLEENFKRFEKLSPSEQANYETLHAKVKQNPHVEAALETFSHWWPTVSAREQAELFKQHDVKQRIAVVGQIQEEVDRERAGRMLFGRSWGRDSYRSLLNLPHESFYQIMAELESVASDTLSIQKELPEIQKLDPKGPQRYLKLFTALHDHQQTWSTLVNSPSIENRVVEAISNPQVKEAMRGRMTERSFGPKAPVVRSVLSMTLGKELYLEAIKQDHGPDFLQKKLDSLSDDDKAELYSYAANDSRIILQMRTMRESTDDSRAAFQPVLEFFQLAGRSGGRGDGRPGDGRPGDGRPGDGRPGDGRPGEGRGDGPPRGESGRGGEGPRRD